MSDNEIFKCDECGDNYLRFTIDSGDEWDFDNIIQIDGAFCKGCIYKMLYDYYHNKVLDMRDFVENW